MIGETLLSVGAGMLTRVYLGQIGLLGGSGIDQVVTNIGLPILVTIGCYLVLRDSSRKELERYKAREATYREVNLSREQTNRDLIASLERRMTAAEQRDERRDKGLDQSLRVISTTLANATRTLDKINTDVDASITRQRDILTAIANLTKSLEEHTTKDREYRQTLVTPALQWVQRMPQVISKVGQIDVRLGYIEQRLKDTGQLSGPITIGQQESKPHDPTSRP